MRRLRFLQTRIIRRRLIAALLFVGPITLLADSPATLPSTGFPTPGSITLHLQDATRKEIFDAFAEKTHIAFGEAQPGFWSTATWPTPTVNLDLDNESFWNALARVQEATDIGLVPVENFESFNVTKDRGSWGWTGRPETVCGPLLLSVRRVTRQSSVHLGAPDKPTLELSFEFIASPVPGQMWLSDETGLAVTSAKDENGRELMSAPGVYASTKVNQRLRFGHLLEAGAELMIPGARAPKLITLSGTLRAVYIDGSARIEHADAQQEPIDCSIVGHTMRISVTRLAGQVQVTLQGDRPEAESKVTYGRFGKRMFNHWLGALKITNADGTALRGTTMSSSFDGDHLVTQLDFLPGTGSGPFTLSWPVPASEREFSFPWEIDQIPLP